MAFVMKPKNLEYFYRDRKFLVYQEDIFLLSFLCVVIIFLFLVFNKIPFDILLQDDISTTEESCDESSNDESFLTSSLEVNSPNSQSLQQNLPSPRNYDEDKMALQQQYIQQQKINEKLMDNQNKILLENLSNLPQNILQNLIQTGQIQLSTDDGEIQLKYDN